jgi:hypothetical protein
VPQFVVDGKWTTDHTATQEKDASGNDNNVLNPSDILTEKSPSANIMSSVGPESTTVGLAKDVPLESEKGADAELPKATPGPDAVPGGFPVTPAAEQQFKVDPLPAAPAAGFPRLAPGEKVPDDFRSGSVTDNVTLDKESYEKSGSDNAHISSVGAGATTVGLAAGVPLEGKVPSAGEVPEVVKESQEKAGFDPEASGVAAEVQEKTQVEDELLQKVPEVPSTSEGTAGKGTEKSENDKGIFGTVTETAAAAGTGILAVAAAAKTAVLGASAQAPAAAASAGAALPESVKQVLPQQAQEAIAAQSAETTRQEVSPEVPVEVKESIAEAGKSPEAAANTEAVEEKKAVEAELLKEVKTVEPVGDSTSQQKAEAIKEQTDKSTEKAKSSVADTANTASAVVQDAGAKAQAAADKAAETVKESTDTAAAKAPGAPGTHASTSAKAGASESPSTTEKKKKNRLSGFFGKLKGKSSKDK